jgi:hypothetical protein
VDVKVVKKSETKNQPLYKTYWPLGEGQGIAVSVWENNLQLQRRVKSDNGEWRTEQEIALARPILEKLYIRLPKLFELMKLRNKAIMYDRTNYKVSKLYGLTIKNEWLEKVV